MHMKKLQRVILGGLLYCVPVCASAWLDMGVPFANTTCNASCTTSAATPTAGNLIAVIAIPSGKATGQGHVTDTGNGLGYEKCELAFQPTTSNTSTEVYVSLSAAAANSTTWTYTTDSGNATGAIIFVGQISGLTRTGCKAIRQAGITSAHASGSSPATTFTIAPLTGNTIITIVSNLGQPPALTAPASFTRQQDSQYATPTSGADYASSDSGVTATTITWGTSSASAYSAVAIEFDSSAPTTPCSSGVPCLVTSHGGGSNQDTGNSASPNTYTVFLSYPPAVTGNLVGEWATTDATRTISTEADNNSTAWTLASSTKTAGTFTTVQMYYLPNAPTSTTNIATTMSGASASTQFATFEFYNVATSTPLDVANGTNSLAGPTLRPGSITPTAGDVLVLYCNLSGSNAPSDGAVTSFIPGSGFTPLITNGGLGNAEYMAYRVVDYAVPINPVVDIVESTAHNYGCGVAAFKAATAGGAPSVPIRSTSDDLQEVAAAASGTVIFPTSTGDAIVLSVSVTGDQNALAVTSSSPTQTITKYGGGTHQTQFYVACPPLAATTNGMQSVTFSESAGSGNSTEVVIYVLKGTKVTSCVDTTVFSPNPPGGPFSGATLHLPDITPGASPGIAIGNLNLGTGPTTSAVYTSFVSPYSGEVDTSRFNLGEGHSHTNFSSTSALDFGYTWATSQNPLGWGAITILAAPTSIPGANKRSKVEKTFQ